MNALRLLCLCCILPLALCQCRTVKMCVDFFRDHSSSGHNSRISGNLPSRAITVDEFIASHAHREVSHDILRTRFRVADANSDGWLTPEEVENHRATAAENKKRLSNG